MLRIGPSWTFTDATSNFRAGAAGWAMAERQSRIARAVSRTMYEVYSWRPRTVDALFVRGRGLYPSQHIAFIHAAAPSSDRCVKPAAPARTPPPSPQSTAWRLPGRLLPDR